MLHVKTPSSDNKIYLKCCNMITRTEEKRKTARINLCYALLFNEFFVECLIHLPPRVSVFKSAGENTLWVTSTK